MLTKRAKIAHRIDTIENWLINDPVLVAGELAISTEVINTVTYYTIKIGNGLDQWSEILPQGTFLSEKAIKDYVISYIGSKEKISYKIIHPYNNGSTDANADFTCLNISNNTSELDTYLSSLSNTDTVVFGKGTYNINSTLTFGTKKVIFDYGAVINCNYNSAYISGQTPFISLTTGTIENGNFLYVGQSSIYQPCINSTGFSKVKNSNLSNFLIVYTGTGYVENNIFEHATETITMNITSGAIVKGNTFKSSGNSGIINVTGASKILYNNVGAIVLAENAGAISAFNTVANDTTISTGNKINDFNFGV